MGETITLTASDGRSCSAYRARPVGPARGGLVVIQTAYGVDDYLKGVCESYARDGFLSIAPALYDRQTRDATFKHDAEGSAKAQALRRGLAWESALADVEAARAEAAQAGAVGIVGFCVGGSVAWLAANALPFAAAASYYGKDVVDLLDKPPRCPIVLHFGDSDRLIPLSDVNAIRVRHPDLPIHVYAAGHGFDANVPEAARLARERTLTLLRAHVG